MTKKLLIVKDSQYIVDLLKQSLGPDFEYIEASNKKEAIKLLSSS